MRELGAPAPVYRGAATGKADRFANRIGGPSATLRRIELEEREDVALVYRALSFWLPFVTGFVALRNLR